LPARVGRPPYRFVVHVPVLVRCGISDGGGVGGPICPGLPDAWHDEAEARRVTGARCCGFSDARGVAAGAALAGVLAASFEPAVQIAATIIRTQFLPVGVSALLAVAQGVATQKLKAGRSLGRRVRLTAAESDSGDSSYVSAAAAATHGDVDQLLGFCYLVRTWSLPARRRYALGAQPRRGPDSLAAGAKKAHSPFLCSFGKSIMNIS
jgi:hypothetical protein